MIRSVMKYSRTIHSTRSLYYRHCPSTCQLLVGTHQKQLEFIRHNQTQPDRKTTALTVISDLKHLRHSPAPALTLGLGGLLPFMAAPAYMVLAQNFSPDIAFAQLAYGASILSFLGGVRWGVTLPNGSNIAPNWTNLTYSVCPSLVAWVGLLLPYPASTLTVMSGLVGAAYFDVTMPGYPSWFKGLRFLLTVVAVLSLWTTFTCKYILKSGQTSFRKTGDTSPNKSSDEASKTV